MKYERELFYRFEEAIVDGKPLPSYTIFSDTPLWHRFSHFLFDSDIKRFARAGSYKAYKKECASFEKTKLSALFIFFIAFLVNVFAVVNLFIFRQKVLVFSVDKVSDKKTKGDFRLSGLYEALSGTSFVECFHTSVGKSFISHLFYRKRVGLYLEGIDGLWYVARAFRKNTSFHIEGLSGTEDEVAFMRYTIEKYFAVKNMLLFRKKVLAFILKYSGIRLVIGIDDVRHYHELLEAAKDNSIKTVLLQHGHFTKYHVGWLASDAYAGMRYVKSDMLLVWSEYWKEELIRLNSVYKEKDILVSGYPSKKVNASFANSIKERVVLIPHETEAPLIEVYEYIKACALCARVYLKIRPDYSIKEQLSGYPSDLNEYVKVVSSLSEVPRPNAVLGVYSTFLYDIGLLGIPILYMETSMDYGEGMALNGIAEKVELRNVCTVLTKELVSPKARIDSKASFNDMIKAQLKEI